MNPTEQQDSDLRLNDKCRTANLPPARKRIEICNLGFCHPHHLQHLWDSEVHRKPARKQPPIRWAQRQSARLKMGNKR